MDFYSYYNSALAERITSIGSMGLLVLAFVGTLFWRANHQDSRSGQIFLTLIVVFLVVMMPLSLGVDRLNYLGSYTSMYRWNDFGGSARDAGFSIYTGIVGRLFLWHVFPYFASIAAIYVGGTVFFAKKFASPAYVLPLCLSFFLGFGFWSYGTNGLRSGMAASLFLIGCALFISGPQKWRKVALVVAFAFALSVHFSMIVPIAAILLAYFFHRPRLFLLGWVGCFGLSLVMGETIQTYIGGFFEDSEDSRAAGYLMADANLSGYRMGFRWDFLAYSCIPIAVSFFYLIFFKVKDRLYDIAICTYLAANGFWLLVIRMSFSNRLAYLSWFFLPVLLLLPLVRGRITLPGLPALAREDDIPQRNDLILITLIGQLAFLLFMYFVYGSFREA